MEEKTAFGSFIAKKRKEAGLTQKELAEKLYVTESAVSKWERAVSYPDISLITDICQALHITEHELITASDDLRQHQLELHAHRYEKMIRGYKKGLQILFALVLSICFIVNLAVSHNLSWFFIVLAALAFVYSFTVLPVSVERKRGLITIAALYLSLNLLLISCWIVAGGRWLGITIIAVLFSFVLLFLPYVLRQINLPNLLFHHKALLCISTDTLLLIGLVAAGFQVSGVSGFGEKGLPITLFSVALPWIYLIILRYTKLSGYFKAALCFIAAGLYLGIADSILQVILDGRAFALPPVNLLVWSQQYINGNCLFLTFLLLAAAAMLFVIAGIVKDLEKRK